MKLRFCKTCGTIIPDSKRKDVIYCSPKCHPSSKGPGPSYEVDGERIPRGTTGAIHELVVCTYLMRNGFNVFRAESPNCPCDIVAMRNDSVFRIEVTTGVKGTERNYYTQKKPSYIFDYLAIVFKDGDIDWTDKEYKPTMFPTDY